MELLRKYLWTPALLFGFCILLSSETCLFDSSTPIKVTNVTCSDIGFFSHLDGKIDTLTSNRIIFKDGGVGVIVIRDALKPGEPDPYAGYEVLMVQNCGEFEVVNLSDKLICPKASGQILTAKCVNLTTVPRLVVTRSRGKVTMAIPPKEPIEVTAP